MLEPGGFHATPGSFEHCGLDLRGRRRGLVLGLLGSTICRDRTELQKHPGELGRAADGSSGADPLSRRDL